ncbi:zinc finger protein 3 homolog [Limanda limanda]|uniref:zinc finger protein 3 homolog n=1 Tax=Limanda limanda TaxID=27771 RepID=UPI0029C9A605|nr:zinc finger protein 3 homolog [Limanda limanda]
MVPDCHLPPITPISIQERDANKLLKRLNPGKAADPDAVSPSTLRYCADQLSPVFTDLFKTSLAECVVPACFKTCTIIPVPNKQWITSLIEYRPVALTSVVIKTFERLVLTHLEAITTHLLDPLQFAYRAIRSSGPDMTVLNRSVLEECSLPLSRPLVEKLNIKTNVGIDIIDTWIDPSTTRPQRLHFSIGIVVQPGLFPLTRDSKSAERRNMSAVQLLRVSVHERISAAAEDFLLQLEKEEETSPVPELRAMLTERLTAAAEEITAVFEETVEEYEDRLERSEREICRQRRLLDAVMKPETRLHRADFLQPVLSKEEVPPEQQQWSPLADQEDPEPPHIKEEQEEPWSNQEGVQLQHLEEADIKFTLTPFAVKSEEDEEKPQSSQLHQSQNEENRADCGKPEPARSSGPDGYLQPGPEDKTEDSSETEDSEDDWLETREPEGYLQPGPEDKTEDSSGTEDSEDDGMETRELQSGLNIKNDKQPLSDTRCKTDNKPFSCSECGYRFKLKSQLTQHMTIHTGEKPFSCTECGKTFRLKFTLKRHMPIHTGEKPFSCAECGKRFIEKSQLTLHMPIHTEEKSFSCSECDKSFRRKEVLAVHLTIHTGEKPFSCSECGYRSRLKHQLTAHMKTHTLEKPLSCSKCGYRCYHENSLKLHMMSHTREKPYSCSECGKTFRYNQQLNEHMMIHTGDKPFSCSECGKRFTRTTVLKTHMRVHTGENPFCCSQCDKAFKQKSELNSHMAAHTGEKPFGCNECAERFRRKNQLNVHMRIHTGEKPFSCTQCAERFRLKNQLNVHIGIHTGEKPFSCSECAKTFSLQSSLKSHMRIHTGQKPLVALSVVNDLAESPI